MPTAIDKIFHNRRASFEKLLSYGFTLENGAYLYRTVLAESGFLLTVTVTKEGAVSTELKDPGFGETYTLHLGEGVTGSFVGEIRRGYETVLNEISEKCFDPFIFKSDQANRCIAFVRERYGDELEFLWEKFPDAAIWRRADNRKWYAVLLTVRESKLGMPSDKIVEIIDLRMQPEEKDALLDGKRYFPGYHMNKNSWFTVVLDGRVSDDELFERIDKSYILAKK